jgi:myo-inositol-1(or 4)-monophosphatase
LSQADLDLLIDAAQEAGELAADLRRRGLEIAYKPGDNTPVTNADLAADALLTQRLRAARPDYGWLSEETADDPERLTRRRLFVVDPVDGTRAFLNDRPWWAVSVAVVDGDRPSAGVVFAPQLEQTYAALAGGGATLNRTPIAPSAVSVLEGSTIVCDPKMLRHPSWPEPWPEMQVDQRNSTALRICLVAAGAADSTLALTAKHDWDLAAADLIATEAGCVVGDHLGRGFRYNGPEPFQHSLLCATPALAPLIRARVRHIAL